MKKKDKTFKVPKITSSKEAFANLERFSVEPGDFSYRTTQDLFKDFSLIEKTLTKKPAKEAFSRISSVFYKMASSLSKIKDANDLHRRMKNKKDGS